MKKNAVSPEIMAEIDERAIREFGLSQNFLMENAGKAVAETITQDSEDLQNENIIVFSGKGNNGGDGLVAARCLSEAGAGNVTVFLLNADGMKAGAAYDNYLEIKKMGLPVKPLNDFEVMSKEILKVTILVDAVFGTGFKGELPETIQLIWEYFNRFKIKKYAVDIPSGLNGDTGEISKSCFCADKTISFGLPKKGFYLNAGPKVCGKIIVKDIGFPKELLEQYE